MLNDLPVAHHDDPRRRTAAHSWHETNDSATPPAPETAAEVRVLLCALVEAADDATASQDMNGTITHWSDAAERLLGFNARESIGASAMRINTLSGRKPARAIVACLSSGQPVDPHYTRLLHKKGWRCIVLLRTVPIRNSTGAICGAMHIARDIDERRRAKARLEHLVRAYPLIALAARRDYGERLADLLLESTNGNAENAASIVGLERFQLLSEALGIGAGNCGRQAR